MEFRKRERPSESPSKEVEEAGEGEAESGAGHDEEGQPGAEQQEVGSLVMAREFLGWFTGLFDCAQAGGDDTMHTMWQEGGGEGDGSGYWHGQVAQGEDGAGGYSQEALWAALKETRDQLNEVGLLVSCVSVVPTLTMYAWSVPRLHAAAYRGAR